MPVRIPLYWFFITLLVVGGTLLEHLPLSVIYSPVAMIIVLGPLPLLALSQLGLGGTRAFVLRLMKGSPAEADAQMIGLMISAAFLFAAFAMVIGNIHVMRNLGNPNNIGPGIALSFVSLVYAILVPIYLLPFLNADSVKQLARRSAMLAFLVVPSLMGLTYFTLSVAKIL